MPRIKWVGMIRDADIYQEGVLPKDAIQLRIPRDLNGMMTTALPFALPPALLCCGSVFLKTLLVHNRQIRPLWIAIGAVLGLLLLLVHELLHAVVYPKEAYVYIGLLPETFTPAALASHPMRRGRFLLMTLLPAVLGIIPLVVFWLLPAKMIVLNSIVFGIAVIGLVMPYMDYYTAFQVLRQTPKQCFVQCEKDDVFYFG